MVPEDWTLFSESTGLAGTRWTPNVRTTDPETSRDAATVNTGGRDTLRAQVLDTLRRHPAGLTDWELAGLLRRHQPSVGKRRGELFAAGLVEFAGEWRLSPLGIRCRVWRVAR